MISLTDLMPHRKPMLLLDGLQSFDQENAWAYLQIEADNIFLRPDELLERTIYPELIAQTFAAGAGAYLNSQEKDIPHWGYLAALRDITIHGDAQLGQRIEVHTKLIARLMNVIVVEGNVYCTGRLLASGQVKIFMPEVTV